MSKSCNDCSGRGTITVNSMDGRGYEFPCPFCGGSGRVEAGPKAHLEAKLSFQGLAPVPEVSIVQNKESMEIIEFHKLKELFLDANPHLNWETVYEADNGSRMVLRTVAQTPEKITVTAGDMSSEDQGGYGS